MTKRGLQRVLILLTTMVSWYGLVQAQMITDAIDFKQKQTNTADGIVTLCFEATLKQGWHIYDVELPDGGPIPTSIELDGAKGVELIGGLTTSGVATEVYDPNFKMNLRWHTGKVTFTQKVQVTDPDHFVLAGDLVYMICNDETCLSPSRVPFEVRKNNLTTALDMDGVIAESLSDTGASEVEVAVATTSFTGDIWKPVFLSYYKDE